MSQSGSRVPYSSGETETRYVTNRHCCLYIPAKTTRQLERAKDVSYLAAAFPNTILLSVTFQSSYRAVTLASTLAPVRHSCTRHQRTSTAGSGKLDYQSIRQNYSQAVTTLQLPRTAVLSLKSARQRDPKITSYKDHRSVTRRCHGALMTP